jgi:CRISPR-associated endoribonuclease Cas6
MPINYNTFVSEFVYELLQPDVPFNAKEGMGEGIQYYTFSNLYIPSVQQEDRTLRFGQVPIELTISLLIDPACEAETFERMKRVPCLHFDNSAGTQLKVSNVEVIKEAHGMTNSARFRMLSPLASPMWETAQNGHEDAQMGGDQRYIHYNDVEFSDSIRGILLAKYERWKGKRPNDTRLQFTLDEKYVQRRRGRISKLVTFHEGEPDEKKVKAIVSPFEVTGNPELIMLGYVAGFGEKNLLGFGCADVVSIAPRNERPFEQRGSVGNGRERFDNSRPAPRRNEYPERQPAFRQNGGGYPQRQGPNRDFNQRGPGQRDGGPRDGGPRDGGPRNGGGFRPR